MHFKPLALCALILPASLLAVSALPAQAAEPTNASYDAWLLKCAPNHTYGHIARSETLADGKTVQGTFPDGRRVLFTSATGGACDAVYLVGRASARLKGTFDAKGTTVKAFMMSQSDGECPGEDEGGCSEVLVVKTKSADYAAAVKVGSCETPVLRAVPLFSKKYTAIGVRCSAPGGGDMNSHSETLYALRFGRLQPLLHVALGYSSSAMGVPQTEKRPDGGARCVYQPPGSFKVLTVGAKPALEVYQADFDRPEAKLKRTRRVWDGNVFAVNGTPRLVAQDAKIVCHDDIKP
jgi:hypothetical protein